MSESQLTHAWRRSRRCESGACVEVARAHGGYAVRDAKDPDGPVLAFTPGAWEAFLAGVRGGEFEIR
ncbi:MAG TPA: DUF397 domain-containing protein [Rugosimonospora sp.]|nr:DUF397 domain-containing protein [Rugosimonospora sp.]